MGELQGSGDTRAPVRGGRITRVEVGLLLLVLLATGAWLVLYPWYSLRGHWEVTHFAFDRLRGAEGEPVLSPELRWTVVLFAALGLFYAAGYVLVARLSSISWNTKIAIVLAGLLPGAVNVGLFPAGALDVFRYMVALRQFLHYGENPYIVGFAAHENDPFARHSWLLSLPNAKGPAWLIISAPFAQIAGIDDPVRVLVSLKLLNFALLGVTAILIGRSFRNPAHGWLAGYGFWANPLVLFEGVGVVHNDVMIAIFTVAALLALRNRSALALPWLTLSVLVKYFTLQLGPLFLAAMWRERWGWRRVLASTALSLLVAAVLIAPFWADGEMIEGVDSVGDAYNRSAHVSIISLARQYRIQDMTQAESRGVSAHRELFALALAILAIPILWGVVKGRCVDRAALDLTLLFLLLLSLLYPWYLITVFAIILLRRHAIDHAYLLIATPLGMLYYPATVWASLGSGYPRLERHLFLAMFLTLPILAYGLVRIAIRSRKLQAASCKLRGAGKKAGFSASAIRDHAQSL